MKKCYPFTGATVLMALCLHALIIDLQANIWLTAVPEEDTIGNKRVAGTGHAAEADWELCTMEDVDLAGADYWNGADGSGGFLSGSAWFPNDFDVDFGTWSGWACSSVRDRTTPGWSNQYSAITGAGFDTLSSGGRNYAVAWIPVDWVTMELKPVSIRFSGGTPRMVKGFYLTNSTYAALAMEQGDDFSKKFGGEDGNDPDWFRASVWGMKDGLHTDTVHLYLADFRDGDNRNDSIIRTWQWVEVSQLGEVDSLLFTLASSDTGMYGMNTPAYFCLDHLCLGKDTGTLSGDPYISEVLEYTPAPGQFINAPPWGTPGSAASLAGGVNGSLSLGAFGGSVVFRFEGSVENHPDHPYGVDFTIFGNPLSHWSEPGIVSVMRDENGNGQPDDTWYELAGSDYFFSGTDREYQITYINPGSDVAVDVPWSDNRGNDGVIPANAVHLQPYYPDPDSFPAIGPASYTLEGTRIRGDLSLSPEGTMNSSGRAFGYADNQLRGIAPYTLPDNPYTPEVENAGGDAFDISWAVDEQGRYVDLDRIDFVRVHTAVLSDGEWLGELSTEITGAARVRSDPSVTGPLDCIVIGELPDTLRTSTYPLEAFVFHLGRLQPDAQIVWTGSLPGASVDNSNMLTISGSGELTLTASLAGNPEITAAVTTWAEPGGGLSAEGDDRVSGEILPPRIWPNPATDFIRIEGAVDGSVSLFSLTGERLLVADPCREGAIISTSALPAGFYLVRIHSGSIVKTIPLVIQ